MRIPFLDLRREQREIEAEIKAALARVFNRGQYILGPEVEAFEAEWASFCEVRGAAGVANGTDALTLALIASGAVRPGHGDEVITSPLTAAYTALAILNAGGVPVFADIDPFTYTLTHIEEALTPRTRAIVPVHLYGGMADMAEINKLATRRGLIVIEDAAQAHGARLYGVRAGGYSHAAAFSFYPTKNLGAYGDGGAVVSNDLALIERVKTLRQGGHLAAIQGQTVGRNSRLDEMQAAVLRIKLNYLEDWNLKRRDLADFYFSGLHNARLALPSALEPGAHVYHLYAVQHAQRDRLRAHLAARGIETAIHYPFLLHQLPLFRRDEQPVLPIAESAASMILSLPLYPQMDKSEARAVIEAILDFEEQNN
jgi:dTDP-4-amino-4,6-dideoxygalactose transaminase